MFDLSHLGDLDPEEGEERANPVADGVLGFREEDKEEEANEGLLR